MGPPWNFRRILRFYPEEEDSCIGTTLRGQQCKNPARAMAGAGRILDRMDAYKHLSESLNDLEGLAEASMCQHYHNGLGKRKGYSQVQDKVQQWEGQIEMYAKKVQARRTSRLEDERQLAIESQIDVMNKRIAVVKAAVENREAQKALKAQQDLVAQNQREIERKLRAESQRKLSVEKELEVKRQQEREVVMRGAQQRIFAPQKKVYVKERELEVSKQEVDPESARSSGDSKTIVDIWKNTPDLISTAKSESVQNVSVVERDSIEDLRDDLVRPSDNEVSLSNDTTTAAGSLASDPFTEPQKTLPSIFMEQYQIAEQPMSSTHSPESLYLPSPPTTPLLPKETLLVDEYSIALSPSSTTPTRNPARIRLANTAVRTVHNDKTQAQDHTSFAADFDFQRGPPMASFDSGVPAQGPSRITEQSPELEKEEQASPVKISSLSAFDFEFGLKQRDGKQSSDFDMPSNTRDRTVIARQTSSQTNDSRSSSTLHEEVNEAATIRTVNEDANTSIPNNTSHASESPPKTPRPDREDTFGYACISPASTRSITYLPATQLHGLLTPPETPEPRSSSLQHASTASANRPLFPTSPPRLSSLTSELPRRKPVPLRPNSVHFPLAESSRVDLDISPLRKNDALRSSTCLKYTEHVKEERQRRGLHFRAWGSRVKNWMGRKSDGLKTRAKGALMSRSELRLFGAGEL